MNSDTHSEMSSPSSSCPMSPSDGIATSTSEGKEVVLPCQENQWMLAFPCIIDTVKKFATPEDYAICDMQQKPEVRIPDHKCKKADKSRRERNRIAVQKHRKKFTNDTIQMEEEISRNNIVLENFDSELMNEEILNLFFKSILKRSINKIPEAESFMNL